MDSPKAMTAAAHKLARIVYHMVTEQQEYDACFQEQERRTQDRKRAKMPAQAKRTRIQVVRVEALP